MPQQTVTVYYFFPDTGEFTGLTDKIPTGDPLPDNSTLTAPPSPQQNVAYLWDSNGSKWDSTADYRRYAIYLIADGHKDTQTALGDIDPAYTFQETPDFLTVYPTQYTYSNGQWRIDNTKVNTALAAAARLTRNALLQASDFIVALDCMIATAQLIEWAKYRQWLRDMSAQSQWPQSPTYPTIPDYTKGISLDNFNTKTTQIAAGNAFAIANPIN